MVKRRTAWRGRAAAVMAVALLALGAAQPASAEEGLEQTGQASYVVSPEGPVKATVTLTLHHTKPDEGRVYYVLTTYRVVIPASVTNVKATSAGAALKTVRVSGVSEGYDAIDVSFSPLRYGKTRTIVVTYDVVGGAIRSKGTTRVGKGYAGFSVVAQGDRGHSQVEIVTPRGYELSSASAEFDRTHRGDQLVWTTALNTTDDGIWEYVTVRHRASSGDAEMTIDGHRVSLQSFLGDDEWVSFVQKNLAAAVPLLEELTGSPWPGRLDSILEDVSPAATGYAYYDSSSSQIVLGEQLDAHTLVHEASHLWFNGGAITERWVQEGLAEFASGMIGPELGVTQPPRNTPDRDAPSAFPLEQWRPPGVRVDATDDYGYAASYAAVRQLLAAIDKERRTEVIAAMLTGRSAYEAAGSRDHVAATSGRRFIDLVEEIGGNDRAAEIYYEWVAPDGSEEVLEQRHDARLAYRGLDDSDGQWRPPKGLRWMMTTWHFEKAEALMQQVEATSAEAGQLQDVASDAGLSIPQRLREAYESADETSAYAEAGASVAEGLDAAQEVREQQQWQADHTDPISRLGWAMLRGAQRTDAAGSAFEGGRFDEASNIVAQARTSRGFAPWLGASAVWLTFSMLGAATVGVVAMARPKRRQPPRPEPSPAGPPS